MESYLRHPCRRHALPASISVSSHRIMALLVDISVSSHRIMAHGIVLV
jgi:hypothetical protein